MASNLWVVELEGCYELSKTDKATVRLLASDVLRVDGVWRVGELALLFLKRNIALRHIYHSATASDIITKSL